MKKILILANNDVGLYKFRKELIQKLINQGNEVYISLPQGELVQPLIDMGCIFIDTHLERRGTNPISDFKLIITYLSLLRNIKPDMVITYTIKPNIYGGMVSRIKKIPYAINITGLGTAFQKDSFLKCLIILLYKISCKKAKVVFFENEENQRIFIDNKIVSEENTCKLNGAGVNIEEYKFCEYPKQDGKINFLFIGRIMKEKGVDELFQTARMIRKEHSNVFFHVVGPLEENYKDIINELQKQDIIIYYGYQKDVKPFIKKAHCFILPSYHEGVANTLLECGAMGRPLITTNISGCREAVLDGKTGYLVKPKDSKDLYDKVVQFISLNIKEKKRMGYKSSQYIRKKFNRIDVVNETIKRLRED